MISREQTTSKPPVYPHKQTNQQTSRGDRQTDREAEWRLSLKWSITMREEEISAGLFSWDQQSRLCTLVLPLLSLLACTSNSDHGCVSVMYFWVWFLCVWLLVCEQVCVCVWDVTPAGAAQHSSLFKGLFVLLQLVQLLGTDKQDLVIWAAKHRPPTPSQKPLRPGPALHYSSENGQTNACKYTNCQAWGGGPSKRVKK